MIRNVKRTWFEVWGTEEAQNHFLKALLVFFVTLCCVQSVALLILALRTPPIFAVSATESRVMTVTPPKKELLETEVRRAINGYVMAHYNWEWAKVDEAFRDAAKFVSPDFSKQFMTANQDQAKVARDKKVSQHFYVSDIAIDVKAKSVRVAGDRILIIEGLRATNPMTVEVQFEYGSRTEDNPEGVYVTGEKLVTAPEGSNR